MLNAEKHKKATAEKFEIKPIKSTIAVESDDITNYFHLSELYGYEIKKYIADKFKKEISDLDVLNLSIFFAYSIITAETDVEKENLTRDLATIIDDKNRLNEFIFTNLATIKSWNETTAKLHDKKDVSESDFNELMHKNLERNQYKAWNDERKILDMYSGKVGDVDGGNN